MVTTPRETLAGYQAIAVVAEAILGLLEEARPRDRFAGATFALYHASNFQSPMSEGVSLYAYKVAINRSRRDQGLLARQGLPLPLDVHFMLTPWGTSAGRQLELLGFAMRALEDVPVLPPGLLRRYGADVFRDDEAVELIGETLGPQDLSYVWEFAKTNLQVSVGYLARCVSIDSALPDVQGRPVQVRSFEIGRQER